MIWYEIKFCSWIKFEKEHFFEKYIVWGSSLMFVPLLQNIFQRHNLSIYDFDAYNIVSSQTIFMSLTKIA